MEDKEKILIEKIEQLNNEYLSSGEYHLGVYVKYLYSLFEKRKYIQLARMVMLHFKQKKTKHKNKDNIAIQSNKYIINNKSDKKIAVYTCITGNYDKVEEPLIMESACDYYLFTNNPNLKSDSWNIREIPEEISKINNNAKINRYIKMHPKEIFPEYDYAIYIDGNIKIISIISKFIEKVNNKTGLAIHRHCERNCIFNEIKACRAYGKGDYSKLKEQVSRYEKEGFPKSYGMLECNVLVSDLKNENAKKIFDGWWNEYLDSESMRDQIAFPYVLWKNGNKVEDIGNLGSNVNINSAIKINTHN